MEQPIRDALSKGLSLLEASLKRGMNTSTSPRFKVVYEQELAEVIQAKLWLAAYKEPDKK